MVGRREELERIRQKLAMAAGGQGQLIGITGEAGMGKSRLIAEAVKLGQEAGFELLAGEAESYGTQTSYLAWQPIWRNFFGLDPSASAEAQIKQLSEELSRLGPDLAPRLPLLGVILNLPIPDNELTRSFEAKLRKSSTEGLLVECLRRRARGRRFLIVLEDSHWLDPLSHDLLEAVGRSIAGLPVLLLMAYRPVLQGQLQVPKVRQLPHFSEIRLSSFDRPEAERLIRLKLEGFFGSQVEASPDLVNRILARAEGNPFYIEELLNYLKDRGLQPQNAQALERLNLPASLQSLILSRLDQLAESQVIALKVASVIGRFFKAAMLWGVYPALGDEQRVIADLENLRRLDLMQLENAEPELTYLFKHVITQEVTYESLPFSTRALLHGEIGQFIEKNFPDSIDQYLDLLAYHYERSQKNEKKREYLLKAGHAAQANYANTAALEYYQRALSLLTPGEQVGVRQKLGQVLTLLGQWQAAEDMLLQAMDLAEDNGDYESQTWCQAVFADLLGKQGKYAHAAGWLEVAREGFEKLGMKRELARSYAKRDADRPARGLQTGPDAL
jgi:predicted ATPase